MFDMRKFKEYRENNRLEVKKAKGGLPVSLWDTYSSFANSYGGVIILGVKENENGSWQAVGLNNEEKLRREFWNLINDKTKISLNLLTDDNVETYEEDGHVIMVIHIPKARREQKPIYINGDVFNGTFRRNWEGDYHCTKDEVLGMLRDQPEETSDMKVLVELSIGDLDYETIRGYRNRHMTYKPGHPWEMLDDERYLERIGAAAVSKEDGELHPTAAGLLMFGEEYLIVKEYPEYFLDYRETLDPSIRWSDRLQSSSGDWTGNLFEFYFRVYNKLIKDIKVPFKLEGGNRIDDTSTHRALREALANCLINTDYYGTRGVVVRKEQDAIIMENPGSVRTGVTQMLKGGISDPRNKALMKMFNMINIGERAGSGVPDIFTVWEEEGWNAPMVEEQYAPDRTILTLSLVNKQAIKTSDNKQAIKTKKTEQHQNKILQYMKDGKEAKASEIAEILGISAVRTRVVLNDMVSNGMLKADGERRLRKYYAALKEISDNKQAIKTSDNKQAIKTNDNKQAIKTSDNKQAIKTSDNKQAIKTSDKQTSDKRIEKTEGHQKKILQLLELQSLMKTNDIADGLGLSISRTRAILNQMVSDGILGVRGSNRNREYWIMDKKNRGNNRRNEQ